MEWILLYKNVQYLIDIRKASKNRLPRSKLIFAIVRGEDQIKPNSHH